MKIPYLCSIINFNNWNDEEMDDGFVGFDWDEGDEANIY